MFRKQEEPFVPRREIQILSPFFDDKARAIEILPLHFVFSNEEMQSSRREAIQQKSQEHGLWTL